MKKQSRLRGARVLRAAAKTVDRGDEDFSCLAIVCGSGPAYLFGVREWYGWKFSPNSDKPLTPSDIIEATGELCGGYGRWKMRECGRDDKQLRVMLLLMAAAVYETDGNTL